MLSLNHAVIEIRRQTNFSLDFSALQSGKSIFKDKSQLGTDRMPYLAAGSGSLCVGNVMINGTLFHLNALPVDSLALC